MRLDVASEWVWDELVVDLATRPGIPGEPPVSPGRFTRSSGDVVTMLAALVRQGWSCIITGGLYTAHRLAPILLGLNCLCLLASKQTEQVVHLVAIRYP